MIVRFLILIILTITFFAAPNKAYCQISSEHEQKIFSLGRSVGYSYYHLVDLCDKIRVKPYLDVKKEYNDTFQNLNLMDIILDDLEISSNSQLLLENLRFDFYNSLNKQDLNQLCLFGLRDAYAIYYKNLIKDVHKKFSKEGSWLFSLGFYTSFQQESLNSASESKLLLSGFHKILNTNPLNLPTIVVNNLKTINSLDKIRLNTNEIALLSKNINEVTNYFESFSQSDSVLTKNKILFGNWEGVLIDSENQKHKVNINVNNNLTASMNIDGIAGDVVIYDVKVINNYFTFMFKPFGGEKLYIKFTGKVTNNSFTGEIIDVLGQKGYWSLSRIEKACKV